VREFGSRPIGQITCAELQDWQARKRQTRKPATVNRSMCRLRHMFDRAVDWELLEQSPMKGIKFLSENNARLRYLSLEECALLIEACKAPRLRAIVTIALQTGMRSDEIRNLEWRDLDFVRQPELHNNAQRERSPLTLTNRQPGHPERGLPSAWRSCSQEMTQIGIPRQ
jgi:integrase